jgi:hypothetical protein
MEVKYEKIFRVSFQYKKRFYFFFVIFSLLLGITMHAYCGISLLQRFSKNRNIYKEVKKSFPYFSKKERKLEIAFIKSSKYDDMVKEKRKIVDNLAEIFTSKCNDRSTNMKDIRKIYREYKKVLSVCIKKELLYKKESHKRNLYFYKDNKEEKTSTQLSKKQLKECLKDVKIAFKHHMRVAKAERNAVYADIDAEYNLAKANRNYYRIKEGKDINTIAEKIKKFEKQFEKKRQESAKLKRKSNLSYATYFAKSVPNFYERADEVFKEYIDHCKKEHIIIEGASSYEHAHELFKKEFIDEFKKLVDEYQSEYEADVERLKK